MEQEFITQEYSAPKSLFDLLPSMPKKKAKGMGERQELICKICFELGIPAQYRSGLYHQVNGIFTNQELIDLKDRALSFRANPAALFRKLVKEKRKQIKESML